MSLLTVFIVIVLVGVALWAVDRFVPMEAGTKQILKIAVVAIMVLWLLKAFGLFDALSQVSV